jgi:imidazoleglycerol phosphate synthase glutamine amidotransferase subunit HisH
MAELAEIRINLRKLAVTYGIELDAAIIEEGRTETQFHPETTLVLYGQRLP